MKTFEVNITLTKFCDYSNTIEAETEEEALDMARDEAIEEMEYIGDMDEEYTINEIECEEDDEDE